MKTKKIILKKGNVHDFFNNIEKTIKEPIKEDKNVLYIENIDIFKKMMTQERIKILKIIKHKKPKSVYELAKILNRDRSNVIFDLNILKNLGLVETKEECSGVRTMTRPFADYDKLELSIEL